jgi:predicted SpoU family rRNA methylase
VAGDLVCGLISSYIIWEARQLGASRWVIGRMMANTLIDTVIGVVPVAGDAFDILFRSNIRNLALLKRHLARRGLVAGGDAGAVIEGEAIRLP